MLRSSSQWLTDASTTFEPVLHVPALGSFVLIMTMALLLQWRVAAINQAADTRITALKTLRQAKANQLTNNYDQNETLEQVQAAVQAYQEALAKEEEFRTLLPGIRIRAPNNQNPSDWQAAQQLLLGTNATTSSTFLQLQQEQQQQQQQREEEDMPSKFPPLALGALWAFVFGSQILLFLFLSMNDTMATEVFNSLASMETETMVSTATELSTTAETLGELMGVE
jgi:hypothetical protein